MTITAIAHSTDEEFDTNILQSETPVLVDFWAEWCGPCKQLSPTLEELADELGERVQLVKHNIDDHPDTPTRYGVRSIPTLILFQNGEAAAVKVGAAPKSELKSWLEENL